MIRKLRQYLEENSLEDAVLLLVLAIAAVAMLYTQIPAARVIDGGFSASLTKENFLLGEQVDISVTPSDAQRSITLLTPDGNAETLDSPNYLPRTAGHYTLDVLLYSGETNQRFTIPFDVVELGSATNEQLADASSQPITTQDIPPEEPQFEAPAPVLPLEVPVQKVLDTLNSVLPMPDAQNNGTNITDTPVQLEQQNNDTNITDIPVQPEQQNNDTTITDMPSAQPEAQNPDGGSAPSPEEQPKGKKSQGKQKSERGVGAGISDPAHTPDEFYWRDQHGKLKGYDLQDDGERYHVNLKRRGKVATYIADDAGLTLNAPELGISAQAHFIPQRYADGGWQEIPLGASQRSVTSDADAATVTLIRPCLSQDCTVTETYRIGFDGTTYLQKSSIQLSSNADGWGLETHRVVWEIGGIGGSESIDPGVKQRRYGDVLLDLSDYAGPSELQESPGNVRAVFEPDGKRGNLDIDPRLTLAPPGTKITIASTSFFQTWNITYDSTFGGVASVLQMPANDVYEVQPATYGDYLFMDYFEGTPNLTQGNWTDTNITTFGAKWINQTSAGNAPGRAKTSDSAACAVASGGCVMGLQTAIDTSNAVTVWVNFTIQADALDAPNGAEEYVRAFVKNSSGIWRPIFDFTSTGNGQNFANTILSWNSSCLAGICNPAEFKHSSFNISFACGSSATTEPCYVDNVSIRVLKTSNNLVSDTTAHEGMDGWRAATLIGGGLATCWAAQQSDTTANLTLLENSTVRMKLGGSSDIIGTGETYATTGGSCGGSRGTDAGNINWTTTLFPDRIVMNKTITPTVDFTNAIRPITFNFQSENSAQATVGANVTLFNDSSVRFDSDINASNDLSKIDSFIYNLSSMTRHHGQYVYKNQSAAIIAFGMFNQTLGDSMERFESRYAPRISLGPAENITGPSAANVQQNFTAVFFFDNRTFWVNDSYHMRDRFFDLYHPDSLEMIDGTLNTTTGGDRNADGFDEQTTCYITEAHQNRTIFNLSSGPMQINPGLGAPTFNVTRFWPCFEVRSYRNLTFPSVEKINSSGRFVLTAGTDYLIDFRNNNSANNELILWDNEYLSNETKFLIGADIWTPTVNNVTRQKNNTDAAQDDPVNLTVSAFDERNTQIDIVKVDVTSPLGTLYSGINVFKQGTSKNFTGLFNNTNEVGTYTITAYANDTTDMVNNTETGQFIIKDLVFPNVSYINSTGGTLLPGVPTNISVNVTDNVRLNQIFASITFPNNTLFNITMFNKTVRYNATPNNFTIIFNDTTATGVYVIRILANDTNNNMNDTVTAQFTVTFSDLIQPNISYPGPPNDSLFNQSMVVNITANITDDTALSMIYVNVTFPNATAVNYTLLNSTQQFNSTPNNFTLVLNDTSQLGRYNLSWYAKDTNNNVNNTITSYFNITACGFQGSMDGSRQNYLLTSNQACRDKNFEINGNLTVPSPYLLNMSNVTIRVRGNASVDSGAEWNMTGIPGGTIWINGNLTIGGSFALINDTLRMNGTVDGESGIEVRNGGKMVVANNSRITQGTTTAAQYAFQVLGGSIFSMTDSNVDNAGWATQDGRRGLEINTTPTNFRDNRLTNNYATVILASNTLVLRNRFDGTSGIDSALYIGNVTGVNITGCVVDFTAVSCAGIKIFGSFNHSIISHNLFNTSLDFLDNSWVGSGPMQNFTFLNNTVNTSQSSADGLLITLANGSRIVGNTIGVFNALPLDFQGNYTVIANNTINRTFDAIPFTAGIHLSGFSNNLTGNRIQHDAGIWIKSTAQNNSLVNNSIFYDDFVGIEVQGDDNNITNNTVKVTGDGTMDVNLTSLSSGNTVWLNHLLSKGMNRSSTTNKVCIGGNGNLYNESIGPGGITLDNADCGIVNVTDALDGRSFNGTIAINWSLQSSFLSPVSYEVWLRNGTNETLLTTTTSLSYSLDTTLYQVDNYSIKIVPNITYTGLRLNATINLSQNFSIVSDPCACLLDNGGTETGTCTVRNAICTSGSNITVDSGGNLTLINTTVYMDSVGDNHLGIDVRSGGEMNIRNNSNITSGTQQTLTYIFKVFSGATFSATDSHLSRMGNSNVSYIDEGLALEVSPLDFRNNSITHSKVGVVVFASNTILKDNRFLWMNTTGVEAINATGFDLDGNHAEFPETDASIALLLKITGPMNHSLIRNNFAEYPAAPMNLGGSTLTNVTIYNNSFTQTGFSASAFLAVNNGNVTRIIKNTFSITGQSTAMTGLTFTGNYSTISNNTFTYGGMAGVNKFGISLDGGVGNTIANNSVTWKSGILVASIAVNNSLSGNIITYNHTGIFLRGTDTNVTNNTLSGTLSSLADLNLSTTSMDNTVWLNHFLSNGVDDKGTNNNFCVLGEGNLYNESIGPDRIALDNTDCGLANITDSMDGQIFSGTIVVNWSNQSTFYSVANNGLMNRTYNLFLDNSPLITSTQEKNYTWDTTTASDGQHVLKLVPNITFNGQRVNATVNLSETFTIDNTGCACILDNQGVEFGTCVVQNAICTSNTNITIQSTGSTTLINSILMMNGTANGALGITVNSSGAFTVVTNSNITTTNFFNHYGFVVQPNSVFQMNDSFVSGVGWASQEQRYGLEVNTQVKQFSNITISRSYIGLVLRSSNNSILNLTVRNITGIAVVINSSNNNTLASLNISDAQTGVLLNASQNTTIRDSVMRGIISGGFGWSSDSSGTAIFFASSNRTLIMGNTFSNISNFVTVHADDPATYSRYVNVTNNTLFNINTGAGFHKGIINVGERITDNTFRDMDFSGNNAYYGFMSGKTLNVPNVFIANNTITNANLTPGIIVVSFENSTFVNNTIKNVNGTGILTDFAGSVVEVRTIANNSIRDSDATSGIMLFSGFANVTNNTFTNYYGTAMPLTGPNLSIVANTFQNISNSSIEAPYAPIQLNSANGTMYHNTFFDIKTMFDANILSNSNVTVVRNHFLSKGINRSEARNATFCVAEQGNLYNESLLPIRMGSGDCGPANLTDSLDGQTFSGTIIVNWTNQSSFQNVTYELYLDNVTLLTSTQEKNYSWNTVGVDNGQHFLKLIPNITFNGQRVNATVNISQPNFTINNPCDIVGVFNITPDNGTYFNRTQVINFSTNVIPVTGNIDQVLANITYPNTSSIAFRLFNVTASNFTGLFNDTDNQYGNYSVRIQANATCGGLNNTQIGYVNVGECYYNGTGHWNIGNRVICENKDIVVSGNITLSATGDLTLLNTTIRMNGTVDGAVGFTSANKLNISQKSNITAVNARYAFDDVGGPLTEFKINDSAVSYAGWTNELGRSGIGIRSLTSLIRNSQLTNNYGILIGVTNMQILNNTIRDTNHTALHLDSKGVIITNNTIQNVFNGTGFGIKMDVVSGGGTFGHQILNNTFANISGTTIHGNASASIVGNVFRDNGRLGTASIFVENVFRTDNAVRQITNNWFNDSAPIGIKLEGVVQSNEPSPFFSVVSNNTLYGRAPTFIGIQLMNGSSNVTLGSNFILGNVSVGIQINASNQTNVSNNTVQSTVRDLELISGNNTVWLNHFLSKGVNNTGAGNRFCLDLTGAGYLQGNLYNESITSPFISVSNVDCGLANLTDNLDNRDPITGQLIVNWTNQSSFLPDVTYNIHAENGSLLNVTTLTNVTINTSIFSDGQHSLRIVPNITQFGVRINATNNQTLNFTTNNFPPDCMNVTNWGDSPNYTVNAPFLTNNRTPFFNCTMDDTGDCFMSVRNESYTDMATCIMPGCSIDCTGDGTNITMCSMLTDLPIGPKTYFLACQNTLGMRDNTSFLNQNLTVVVLPMASCTLNQSFRGLEFGEMMPGDPTYSNNDTRDDAPKPLIIINTGNMMVNVSFNVSNLWTNSLPPTDLYSYLIQANESNSYGSAQDTLPFNPFAADRFAAATAVTNLRYVNSTNIANSVEVEVNVTVPSQEPAGQKYSTIEILCTQNEGLFSW